jgi:ABC-type transport system involved in multi-copper enzyme maturation permease subunit
VMAALAESLLYRAFGFNACVAIHELRLRMRAGRGFLMLLTYALFAALAVLVPVRLAAWQRGQLYGPGSAGPDLGRVGLHALAYTELTLIFIALPAYAAGTITSEREKRTLAMLRVTLLTPGDVVTGKLIVVVAFAAVLLGATVPVAAWCLLLGGVGPSDVIHVYAYLFAVAVAVSALGVLLSTRFQRSLGSIVATYAALFGVSVGSALLMYVIAMVSMISYHRGSPAPLGDAAAVALTAVPLLLTAWLLLLAARWVIGRLPVMARLRGSIIVAIILFAAAVGLVTSQASGLITKLANAQPMVLIMLNPYASIAAILEESAARELISSTTTPGTTTPAADLQNYVWWVLMWATVVVALALWALGVRLFRGKPE